ncbi:hypothetical protein SARC_05364 [Sphaeroforma arctica JP610]|uniref:MICOS complex subunit MIC60 n=1 Tax=Sphaeroforma arctica JP610 TaxID=667725 RepID=A0A0L0FZV0_9EUKA|nr:hypothetical protein SARC_05364 [Sphaeroforma arctica JP610]KNC82350.1 hypothetical protein SARC_05364 [Sphaeroforma arctica JP610]|eukprot:XP_014156252.1 hypothetical protein SARC_05364 [Sphaeroforma arctica JP610]
MLPALIGFVGGSVVMGGAYCVYMANEDAKFRRDFEAYVPGGKDVLDAFLGPKAVIKMPKPDLSWKNLPVGEESIEKAKDMVGTVLHKAEDEALDLVEKVKQSSKDLASMVYGGSGTSTANELQAVNSRVTDNVEDAADTAKENAQGLAHGLDEKAGEVLPQAPESSDLVPDGVKEVTAMLQGVAVGSTEQLESVTREVTSGLTDAVSTLRNKAHDAKDSVEEAVEHGTETLKDVLQHVEEAIVKGNALDSAKHALEHGKDELRAAVHRGEEALEGVVETAKDNMSPAALSGSSKWVAALDSTKEKLHDAAEKGEEKARAEVSRAAEAGGDALNETVVDPIKGELDRAVETGADGLSTVAEVTRDGASTAADYAKDGVSVALGGLNAAVDKVSGVASDTAEVVADEVALGTEKATEAAAEVAADVNDTTRIAARGMKELTLGLTDKAGDAASGIKDKAVDVAGDVYDKAGNLVTKAEDMAGDVYDKAGNLVNKAENVAGDAKDKAVDVAGDVYDKAGNLVNKAENVAGDAKDKAVDVYDKAGNLVHKAEDKAGNLANKAGDVAGGVYDKAGNLVTKAKDMAGDVYNKAGNLVNKAEDVAGDAKNKAVDVAGDAKDKAEDVAADMRDRAGNAIDQAESAAHNVQDKAQEVGADIKGTAQDAQQAVGDEVSELTNSLSERIRESVQAADELAENVGDKASALKSQADKAKQDMTQVLAKDGSEASATEAEGEAPLETFFQKRLSEKIKEIDENMPSDLAGRAKTMFLANELNRLVHMVSLDEQENEQKLKDMQNRLQEAEEAYQQKLEATQLEHTLALQQQAETLQQQMQEQIVLARAQEKEMAEAAVAAEAALHDKLVEEEKHVWHSQNNEEQLNTIKRLETLYEHYYQDKLQQQAGAQYEIGKQALLQRLAKERTERLAALEAMTARLQNLDALLTKSKEASGSARRLHAMYLGRSAIQHALDSNEPLAVDRDALALAGTVGKAKAGIEEEDNLYQMAVKCLPDVIFSSPLKNYGQLQSQFKRLRPTLRKSNLMPEDKSGNFVSGVATYTAACVADALTFRREPVVVAGSAQNEVIEETDTVLARVEFWLDQGDLKKAVAAARTLSGNAKDAASDWIADVDALLATQLAVRLMDTFATNEATHVFE